MKRISEIIITIIVLGVIVYSFGVKADRDQLISTGKEIMLELAPIDPLSLLQGQYMIINFALENDEVDVEEDEINPNRVNSGFDSLELFFDAMSQVLQPLIGLKMANP